MNIYVGNLHYHMSEDELKKIFEEYGEVVSAKIITDKYSGRSKGFGFIEMTNEAEGEEAVKNLNGTEIQGRNVVVNVARERSNDRPRGEER